MRLRQYARYSLGRILGTISNTSERYRWFVDNQERSLFIRAELNTITKLLIDKKIITQEEWEKASEAEFEAYDRDLAGDWPEIKVAASGRSFAIDPIAFAKRCKAEEWTS